MGVLTLFCNYQPLSCNVPLQLGALQGLNVRQHCGVSTVLSLLAVSHFVWCLYIPNVGLILCNSSLQIVG